jgi:DNA-repair protein complementing XP-A cells
VKRRTLRNLSHLALHPLPLSSRMSTIERPSTPPRQGTDISLALTPEHVKRVELNRLRGKCPVSPSVLPVFIDDPAKARQRQREEDASASGSSDLNSSGKRSLANTVIPANSTSPTAPTAPPPLKRDTRLIGNYFEYDLSKMVNSKGGFLVGDGEDADLELREKEKQRELERVRQNFEPSELVISFPIPTTRLNEFLRRYQSGA